MFQNGGALNFAIEELNTPKLNLTGLNGPIDKS